MKGERSNKSDTSHMQNHELKLWVYTLGIQIQIYMHFLI